jgi:transcriptional regulator with XRE-family HTH domain
MSGSDDLLKRFGQRVRSLRLKAGFSQEGFAHHCGLDRTYMGGVERGERNLSLRNIGVIARALGITLAKLMSGLG